MELAFQLKQKDKQVEVKYIALRWWYVPWRTVVQGRVAEGRGEGGRHLGFQTGWLEQPHRARDLGPLMREWLWRHWGDECSATAPSKALPWACGWLSSGLEAAGSCSQPASGLMGSGGTLAFTWHCDGEALESSDKRGLCSNLWGSHCGCHVVSSYLKGKCEMRGPILRPSCLSRGKMQPGSRHPGGASTEQLNLGLFWR